MNSGRCRAPPQIRQVAAAATVARFRPDGTSLALAGSINAAQASSPGARGRIELDSSATEVTVRIVDAGRGIDDTVLATVGAPFQTTKENGTGLGLPIARRIAVARGGELTLEKAETGTIAVVRLPAGPTVPPQ